MTLTQRNDNQVAKEEGVLLNTDGEYVNAKANETNELAKASSDENHLVATPAEAKTVTAETGCKLYRLTYNKAEKKRRSRLLPRCGRRKKSQGDSRKGLSESI